MTAQVGLLIPRPLKAAIRFRAQLETALPGRFAPLIAPLLEIEPLAAELDLTGIAGLIFTSEPAVRRFAALSPDRTRPAYCVGHLTTNVARDLGLEARRIGQDAQSLAGALTAAPPPAPLLHVRGRHAALPLAAQLTAAGIPTREVIVYAQAPAAFPPAVKAALRDGSIRVVTLFSPRTGMLFREQARGGIAEGTTLACLSRAVAEAVEEIPGVTTITTAEPTSAAMIALLASV